MMRIATPLLIVLVATACESHSSNQDSSSRNGPSDSPAGRRESMSDSNSPTATPSQRSGTNNSSASRSADMSPQADAATVTDAQLLSILHLKDNEEVAIGRLAQQKASSQAAKRFGDMLVTDHTEHAKTVSDTAQSAGLTLVSDDAAKRELDRLKSGGGGGDSGRGPDPLSILQPLTGAEFDKKFGELMLQGHRDLIKVLEIARPRVKNPEVRALVDKTLPVLRHHEKMAREVGESQR